MSNGMWGVAFSIVQARMRKLLKRMIASPMQKREYLFAHLLARLLFLAPEVGGAARVRGARVRDADQRKLRRDPGGDA